MKALVTGASGFLGSHLVFHLAQKGWSIRVLIHKSRPSLPPEVEIFQGNVQDILALKEAAQGCDAVFHLAAALGASRLSQKDFSRINAQGTRNILEAAAKAGVKRVLHVSSAGVLGSVRKGDVANERYAIRPISLYDKTKLEGETAALDFAGRGLDVVIVRPGWVYGPGDRRTFKLVRAIAKKRFALVIGGKTRQSPVFIDDIVQGIIAAFENGRPGEIYNLAGHEVLSVKQIVKEISASLSVRTPSFPLPRFLVTATASTLETFYSLFNKEAPLNRNRLSFFIHAKPLSIKKAEQELGYRPEVDFHEGILRTVSWYRDHAWLT